MTSFRENISNQDGLAVTTDRVLEDVSKFALAVRHMVTFLVTGADDYLLQVRKTTVDVGGLLHSKAFSPSLFSPLTSSEVDQRQARMNNLFGCFNCAARLQVDCENSVRSARSFVDSVIGSGTVLLTFKEAVERFFLTFAMNHGQALKVDLTFVVVLNVNVSSSLLVRGLAGEHIEEELIVNFNVGNLNRDLSVKTAADFRENLANRPRDESTVLEVGGGASHREGLSGAGLTVAHNGTVESIDNSSDRLGCAVVEEAFLGSVMH